MNIKMYSSAAKLTACTFLLALLQACGSGSGASTSANPQTTAPDVSNYSGPAPATADVQSFKLNMWDNLVPNNRCGSCHNDTQNPRFVRADDINLAYAEANNIVDLTDPANSLIVNKVRGGHNCWLSSDDACGDIIQSYIENWAGASLGSTGKEVTLEAPPLTDPGASKNFPADTANFGPVHTLLTTYCSNCHNDAAAVPQSPYFASTDIATAYAAAQPRIDLETPANSRFVVRLGQESHNCWTNCQANATEMENVLTTYANTISPTQVDPDLVTSKALLLTDGIISSAGGRHETNVIALYEFKTGTGNTAFDTSGIEPSLNLTLSGTYDWLGGWGVQFMDGKAQGSTTASAKLRDLITATGEFSLEVWAAPGNVTQDGPARIVTYSGGSMSRNFMLGQTLYNYDTFVRSDQTDPAGEPQFSTPDADEILQATLQHTVVTYDPANGRQIYVNGTLVDQGGPDPTPGGLLNDWDDTFALAVASEVDNQDRWAGTVRLLAVHNRVLTPEQVFQNFEVGVGEKYYLLFNVSDHIAVADAYVVFEVSQFDNYSYLFDEPFFVILDSTATPGTIPVQGMRIGLNGREVAVGQAFANMDMTITDAEYAVDGLQSMATMGTIIPQEKGPTLDEFFLTFELLGSATNVYVEADPSPLPPPPDLPLSPEIGVRDFAEINAAMSAMTDVPVSNPEVAATYATVHQALPVNTGIGGFISSQQMAITQLAIKYCSVLVDDTTLRATYFPGFPFGTDESTAFTDRTLLLDPLVERMVGNTATITIGTQPDEASLRAEVNSMVDDLIACGGACPEPDRTESIVKAACASVLGSAAVTVQ